MCVSVCSYGWRTDYAGKLTYYTRASMQIRRGGWWCAARETFACGYIYVEQKKRRNFLGGKKFYAFFMRLQRVAFHLMPLYTLYTAQLQFSIALVVNYSGVLEFFTFFYCYLLTHTATVLAKFFRQSNVKCEVCAMQLFALVATQLILCYYSKVKNSLFALK